MPPKAIIIAGPTASGKTHFAHNFALKYQGEIINSDAMQLYRGLELLTASPAQQLKEELPYHLYNFQDVNHELSSASYTKKAAQIVKEVTNRGNLPILVGGSGLYLKMLIQGYSNIPDIEPALRAEIRQQHQQLGHLAFYQKLADLDPKITQKLNQNDTQRIIRAYEVIKQTGKSLLYFQKHKLHLLPAYQFYRILLSPSRLLLKELCHQRLEKLFHSNLFEEVESLLKNWGDLNSTAMKTLGVKEISAYLQNKLSKNEALAKINIKTRQYAKRQVTWFKNQLQFDQIIEFDSIEEYEQQLNEVSLPLEF